ncbi:TerB family tellurite resistance protein [Oleisolibacter albus]|uniref:tellurite resistance TerB family protein n=1 Tax=Oleisolibacter albus TaxID=2171757 RepID=UPI000DF1F308|nr:TerB family tellurite resistance protein [Oleisolibacter albus]
MLNRIRRLFDQPDRALASLQRPDRLHLAAAVLMLEAAGLDDSVTAEETGRIHALVRSRFGLDTAEADDLLASAAKVAEGPAQWHRFTSTLADAFDYDERVQLIEMLWEVAYADGELHHLESSLLRRVGGLLYVSDRDRGEAQRRVKAKLGLPQGPALPE